MTELLATEEKGEYQGQMVTKVNEEMMVFPGSQEFPARKESAGTMVCQDCPEWMAALVEKDLPEHLDRQEFPRAAHQENLGSRVGQERRVILDSLETTDNGDHQEKLDIRERQGKLGYLVFPAFLVLRVKLEHQELLATMDGLAYLEIQVPPDFRVGRVRGRLREDSHSQSTPKLHRYLPALTEQRHCGLDIRCYTCKETADPVDRTSVKRVRVCRSSTPCRSCSAT